MTLKNLIQRGKSRTFATLVIQAIVRLGSSVATVKILTIFLLPSQLIIYGQIQTLMQLYSAFTTSIASTKLSALIAGKENSNDKNKIFDTALFLISILFLILLGATTLFGGRIAAYIAADGRGLEISILPLAAFAVAYCALIQAYFTGIGDIHRFSRNSIITILAVSVSTLVLTVIYGAPGAMLSIGISPIFACVLIILIESPMRKPEIANIHISSAVEVTGFTVSSILTLVGYYFAQLYVRSQYSQIVSPHEAGLLTAANRISDVYMGVLAVFYANILTRIYAKTLHKDRLRSIYKVYGIFIISILPGFIILATTTSYWIPILLSDKYSEAQGHMSMQMIGDVLKCLYWIALYYVISKLRTFIFFWIEFSGLIIYVIAAILNPFSSEKFSPQIAQIIEYSILLFIVNIIVFCKNKNNND